MLLGAGHHQESQVVGRGQVRSGQVPNITGNCSSVGPALAGDLPHLELGEGPVGSFIEV